MLNQHMEEYELKCHLDSWRFRKINLKSCLVFLQATEILELFKANFPYISSL